ncbi:MAG: ribbon-helix-helix protein, CopG family [Armatimonadetes bacterium]|nr:ribbon-helix-helix protein, CopG family [Armatimonadota bacterium]
MRRKQIYIDEQDEQRLKAMARQRGRSEASLIREAVRRFVSDETPPPSEEGDPLLQLIGIADGRTDAAEHHDRYLYGSDR